MTSPLDTLGGDGLVQEKQKVYSVPLSVLKFGMPQLVGVSPGRRGCIVREVFLRQECESVQRESVHELGLAGVG